MLFLNRSFDKKRLKALLLWFRLNLSEGAALKVVEILQELGFRFATQGAISLGLDDLKTPSSKGGRVFQAQLEVALAHHEHHRGNRTPVELFQHLVDTWHRTSQDLTTEVVQLFHSTERVNPVYMMAFSGARGNISQVRQLVGMRGLMADPRGQIVGFPILSNFREGLTITEYFVSCYGARKGVVDTAIRTADAGYLTRRLADVSHHVVVRTTNCGTYRSIKLQDIKEGKKTILSLANRLVGRVLAEHTLLSSSVANPSGVLKESPVELIKGSVGNIEKGKLNGAHFSGSDNELVNQPEAVDGHSKVFFDLQNKGYTKNLVNYNSTLLQDSYLSEGSAQHLRTKYSKPCACFASRRGKGAQRSTEGVKLRPTWKAYRNSEITPFLASKLALQYLEIAVRSPLSCSLPWGVCQLCYGWGLSEGRRVTLGEAVGIIAAQSIGEPGTQLTLRTFHTGGVFSGELLNEIRAPFNGTVHFPKPLQGLLLRTPHGQIAFLAKVSGKMTVYSIDVAQKLLANRSNFAHSSVVHGHPTVSVKRSTGLEAVLTPFPTVSYLRYGRSSGTEEAQGHPTVSYLRYGRNSGMETKYKTQKNIEGVYQSINESKQVQLAENFFLRHNIGTFDLLTSLFLHTLLRIPKVAFSTLPAIFTSEVRRKQAQFHSNSLRLFRLHTITTEVGNGGTGNIAWTSNRKPSDRRKKQSSHKLIQSFETRIHFYTYSLPSASYGSCASFHRNGQRRGIMCLLRFLRMPRTVRTKYSTGSTQLPTDALYSSLRGILPFPTVQSTGTEEAQVWRQSTVRGQHSFLRMPCFRRKKHRGTGNIGYPTVSYLRYEKSTCMEVKQEFILVKHLRAILLPLYVRSTAQGQRSFHSVGKMPLCLFHTCATSIPQVGNGRKRGKYSTYFASRRGKEVQLQCSSTAIQHTDKQSIVNKSNNKIWRNKNIIKAGNKKKQDQEFIIQPSTVLFVRQKEQVYHNQLLAEFSSSTLLPSESKNQANDQIEMTQQVLSETAGQVWFKEIDYGNRKGAGSGSLGTHFSSQDLGGIWVLAGKPMTNTLTFSDRQLVLLNQPTIFLRTLPPVFAENALTNPSQFLLTGLKKRRNTISTKQRKENNFSTNPSLCFEDIVCLFSKPKGYAQLLTETNTSLFWVDEERFACNAPSTSHMQRMGIQPNISRFSKPCEKKNRQICSLPKSTPSSFDVNASLNMVTMQATNVSSNRKFIPQSPPDTPVLRMYKGSAKHRYGKNTGMEALPRFHSVGRKKHRASYLRYSSYGNAGSTGHPTYGMKAVLLPYRRQETQELKLSPDALCFLRRKRGKYSTVGNGSTHRGILPKLFNTSINKKPVFRKPTIPLLYESDQVTFATDSCSSIIISTKKNYAYPLGIIARCIPVSKIDINARHKKKESTDFYVFPGQFIAYGDNIINNIVTTESGQVLYINSQKITLRKAQTVLIYSQAIVAVFSEEWIKKGTPLMSLSYQKLVTGDIVQGLPKIEQFFEARMLKDGTFWSGSLQAQLNQFFQEYKERKNGSFRMPLAEAVRKGFSKIQRVLVEGVQRVYISQGVLIADKHLEVIVRQMTCKGRILYSGDTGFLRNELVSLDKIENVNQVIYGQKALYHPQVRGITDASLESESFLSAASFQETTRVLSRDAIIGKTDLMRGLKERVIVGELIQAGTGLANNSVYSLI